jgi:transcriptional regulator with XRE-family HTH domain
MNKIGKVKKYNRIKVELAEAGKQNTDLAKYIGVHPSTVSDWCTNTNQPSVQDLFKISEFLKINVRDLLVPTKWDNETLTQAAENEPTPIHKLKSSQRLTSKSKQKPKGTK